MHADEIETSAIYSTLMFVANADCVQKLVLHDMWLEAVAAKRQMLRAAYTTVHRVAAVARDNRNIILLRSALLKGEARVLLERSEGAFDERAFGVAEPRRDLVGHDVVRPAESESVDNKSDAYKRVRFVFARLDDELLLALGENCKWWPAFVIVANLASSPTHVVVERRLVHIGGGDRRRVVNSWRRILDRRGDGERDKKRSYGSGRTTREHLTARRQL